MPRLAEFEGRGVWYWASALEARMCAKSEVVLVGGGNSAGQAAVFLSQHAAKVHMLVRGPSLAASMSRYLIDRIDATHNIELMSHTAITELHGDAPTGLAGVTWHNSRDRITQRCEARHVFLFVGAEMLIPTKAVGLDCEHAGAAQGELHVRLADGRRLRSRTVVIASGARYRRPAVPRLGEFEGRGVWFWASAIEARLCARTEVALVGGGNSAGQAAVFLAQHAERVAILVRGPGLAASMSRYLIDRIEATPNIILHTHTELTALHGDPASGLAGASWRDRLEGTEERCDVRNLFLFVGAEPETEWLKGCNVAVDAHGFVRTGRACSMAAGGRDVAALETNVPGIFAVGDVRSGSVKRVGGAIGEGAAVVAQIHQTLAARAAA